MKRDDIEPVKRERERERERRGCAVRIREDAMASSASVDGEFKMKSCVWYSEMRVEFTFRALRNLLTTQHRAANFVRGGEIFLRHII